MKILLDKNKNYYKGNMHCHSNLSDGKLSPLELKERYKNDKKSSVVSFVQAGKTNGQKAHLSA